MLYANDVISEHNKLQIFIANEEKSSQELLPADHAEGKLSPNKLVYIMLIGLRPRLDGCLHDLHDTRENP